MSTFAIINHRTGTAAQWTSADPVLEVGELGFESNTNRIKIGDGAKKWSELSYAAESNLTPDQQRASLEIFNSQTTVTSGTDRVPFAGKIYVADPTIVGANGNNLENPAAGDLWFW